MPVQELKIDPETLPEGFSPPQSKDKLMSEEVRLAEPDEIDKLKKDLAKFSTVLRKSSANDNDKAIIRNGFRYRLALMCLKENRPKLSDLHEALLRDTWNIASVPDTSNPAVIKSFRQSVLQELVNQISPMLADQNFYVRLHLTMLLGELDLTQENSKLNFKLEAFAPATLPLIKVIVDPEQPEAVKIAAVNGLVRILKIGNPNHELRTKIAEALVTELRDNKSHLREVRPNSWYQMRLTGALAAVDIDLDQARKPFVVEVLKMVLADDARPWSVRAEAAKSLGRVPIPSAASPSSVTRAVAEFALKLAKAAQQSPQTKEDDPKWKSEFIRVYLAFQQLDATDMTADRKFKAGLLNNPAALARGAYDLIVPLVAAILHGQRLTVQQVQTLEAWVTPTQPAAPTQSSNDSRSGESPMALGAGGPKQ